MTLRPDGIVIAIDGPSGAGKSTIAALLAEHLGYIKIDTGAMYRAAAFMLSKSGIILSDIKEVERFCQHLDIRLELNFGKQKVTANGIDVTEHIRTPEMSLLTSQISTIKQVRDAMLKAQQELGKRGGVVLEGRDIGTVVFPDAEIKFYLSASAEKRAKRRFDELNLKGFKVNFEETMAEVIKRDSQDSERDIAPLRQAPDSFTIDSSMLTIQEVLIKMISICREKIEKLSSLS